MRTFFLLFMFLLISSLSNGQQQGEDVLPKPDTGHSQGDLTFYLTPDILMNTPNGTQFAGGMKSRFFFAKRFSFDTDLVFSHDYFRASPGLIGFPLLIIASFIDYSQLFEKEYYEEWDPAFLPVYYI